MNRERDAYGNGHRISLKTIETYRAAIMRTLNLSSSAALVRYAIPNRIVEAQEAAP